MVDLVETSEVMAVKVADAVKAKKVKAPKKPKVNQIIQATILKAGRPKLKGRVVGFGYRARGITLWEQFAEVKTDAPQGMTEGLNQKLLLNCGLVDDDSDGYDSKPQVSLDLWPGDRIEFKTNIKKEWVKAAADSIKIISKNQASRDAWKVELAARKEQEAKEAAARAEEEKAAKELEAKRLAEERASQEAARAYEEAQKEAARVEFFKANLPADAAALAIDCKGFDAAAFLELLRWAAWLRFPMGIGGHRCPHVLENPDGKACGCQFPGTGFRQPGAPLYDIKNRLARINILRAAGLITGPFNNDDAETQVKATKKGKEFLAKIDTCPTCGKIHQAYWITNTYSAMSSEGGIAWQSVSYQCQFVCGCFAAPISSGGNGSNSTSMVERVPGPF